MSASNPQKSRSEQLILGQAAVRAATFLGLTTGDLGQVIGRHRTTIGKGLDPESNEGQLAMMFIRCYRNLFALMDGNAEQMKHWMRTENSGVGGIPGDEIRSIRGMSRVLDYLDAMRGKV